MSFHSDIMGACRGRDTDDALSAIRRTHGRGATAFIAEQTGLSPRQALRYLKGEVKHTSPAVTQAIEDSVSDGVYAADVLGEATYLDCGTVEVEYNGKPAGTRTIGRIPVTAEMRDTMTRAGELYAAGNDDAADALMSVAILGGYCQSRGDGYGDLADEFGTVLDVSRFQGGFSLT